jgi:hypothetical protein
MMAFGRSALLLGAGLVALRAVVKLPLSDAISWMIDRGSFGPTAEQRRESRFTILCRARSGSAERQVVVEGRDPAATVAERLSK